MISQLYLTISVEYGTPDPESGVPSTVLRTNTLVPYVTVARTLNNTPARKFTKSLISGLNLVIVWMSL